MSWCAAARPERSRYRPTPAASAVAGTPTHTWSPDGCTRTRPGLPGSATGAAIVMSASWATASWLRVGMVTNRRASSRVAAQSNPGPGKRSSVRMLVRPANWVRGSSTEMLASAFISSTS